MCGEAAKLTCHIGSITIKTDTELSGKKLKNTQQHFYNNYCLDSHLGNDGWDFTHFEQCETHKQLKEKKAFRQNLLPIRS